MAVLLALGITLLLIGEALYSFGAAVLLRFGYVRVNGPSAVWTWMHSRRQDLVRDLADVNEVDSDEDMVLDNIAAFDAFPIHHGDGESDNETEGYGSEDESDCENDDEYFTPNNPAFTEETEDESE